LFDEKNQESKNANYQNIHQSSLTVPLKGHLVKIDEYSDSLHFISIMCPIASSMLHLPVLGEKDGLFEPFINHLSDVLHQHDFHMKTELNMA
jgi:hypothetical protein